LIGTLGGLPVATALRFAGPACATCAEMARIHINNGIIRDFISILFAHLRSGFNRRRRAFTASFNRSTIYGWSGLEAAAANGY
jgi:hypothetical protein